METRSTPVDVTFYDKRPPPTCGMRYKQFLVPPAFSIAGPPSPPKLTSIHLAYITILTAFVSGSRYFVPNSHLLSLTIDSRLSRVGRCQSSSASIQKRISNPRVQLCVLHCSMSVIDCSLSLVMTTRIRTASAADYGNSMRHYKCHVKVFAGA